MKHAFLALAACAAIFSVSGTSVGGLSVFSIQGQLARTSESSNVTALKALTSPPGGRLGEIRALGSSVQNSAAPRLLEIFEENRAGSDAFVELELVRALSLQTQGRERDSVVRALLSLFEPKREVVSESTTAPGITREFSVEHRGALFDFARGSAALALAHAQHAQAARVLVLTASATERDDPLGTRLAREALREFPLSVSTKKELGQLVDLQTIESLNAPPALRAITVSTPSELHQLAVASEDPLALSREEAAEPLSTWRDVIEALGKREVWPSAFLDTKQWEQASTLDGPWTLRALALLSSRQEKLRKFSKSAARTALHSDNKDTRSAASFLLAVLAPEEALQLLSANDIYLRGPALSQAFKGQLAIAALQLARSKQATERLNSSRTEENAALNFSTLALKASLHEPDTWANWSTRTLWALGISSTSSDWMSPLAARMTTRPSGTAPTVSQVSGWLNHRSAHLRAAAVRGLEKNATSSARGLLLSAYRWETDVAVRRGICRAIFTFSERHGLDVATRSTLTLTQLDPDRACRALAQGKADPEARGFRVFRASSGQVEVLDRQGSVHQVFVAPDGFVGLVGADL